MKGYLIIGMLLLAAEALPANPIQMNNAVSNDILPYVQCNRTETAPKIDGVLNDACWNNAVEMGPFVLADGKGLPQEGAWAYMAHDGTNLYLAVECEESLLDERLQRTHEIRRGVKTHDGEVWQDDSVEVFIGGKGKEYYRLVVNSLGVVYDARNESGADNKTWESGVSVGVGADDKIWRVELSLDKQKCGIALDTGGPIRVNIGRNRWPVEEHTSWSPASGGLHKPEQFGTASLSGKAPIGIKAVKWGGIEDGVNAWRAVIGNNGNDARSVKMKTLIRYGDSSWVACEKEIEIGKGASLDSKCEYVLTTNNNCFYLDAAQDKIAETQSCHTDYMPIKPDSDYVVSALARAEGLKQSPGLFISTHDSSGKVIKGYEPALAFPAGTYNWQNISGKWRSPTNAAKAMLFMVKWAKQGIVGKLWMDDLRLSPPGSMENLVPNGALEKDGDGAIQAWPVSLPVVSSGNRDKNVTLFFQVSDQSGALLYSSAAISGAMQKRNTILASGLMFQSTEADSEAMYRVKELFVAEDSPLLLQMVFKSDLKNTMKGCSLVLETPDYLKLINPAPRGLLRDVTLVRKDDGRYYRYVLDYPAWAVSPAELKGRRNVRFNYLVLHCGFVRGDNKAAKVYYHAETEGFKEDVNVVDLNVLTPLSGKRPAGIHIINDNSYFTRKMSLFNESENDALFSLWQQAGINQLGRLETPKQYGFVDRLQLPLVPSGDNFPGGLEYLRAHPEACAVAFNGITNNTVFCPTYFMSNVNGHLADVNKWLMENVKVFKHLDYDLECPVLKDNSICACDRCLKTFGASQKLKTNVKREEIRTLYKKEWVDFRCQQNAEIAGLFRETIKKSDRNCLFSVYSGYQGTTDEQYGADWRYLGRYADLVWCGYGRPVEMIKATHAAIGKRPFIGGELVWFNGSSATDQNMVKVNLYRRLADCGSGVMAFTDGIVDGRFYTAISGIAGLASKFGSFFAYEQDRNGEYVSHYERNDALVEVGGEGRMEDVTVLVHGDERLVFLFNEGVKDREYDIRHNGWKNGYSCVEYENKTKYGERSRIKVKGRDVAVLHVRNGSEAVEIGAPEVIRNGDGVAAGQVALAWEGRGSQVGDQEYLLELSAQEDFGGKIVTTNTAKTVYVVGTEAQRGKKTYWRVKGRDVVSGKEGPYSKTASFTAPVYDDFYISREEICTQNSQGIVNIFGKLSEPTKWTAQIVDANGKNIRSFEGKGDELEITWDGKDTKNNPVAEGEYKYSIRLENWPEADKGGTLRVNNKVGIVNESLSLCRGWLLSSASGIKMEKDFEVNRNKTYAYRFTAPRPRGAAYYSNYPQVFETSIPVEPGKKYRFSAYVKCDLTEGYASIAMTFFKAEFAWAPVSGWKGKGGASGYMPEEVKGKTDWVKQEIELTAPKEAASAVLFLRIDDALGSCWFDELEFKEVE
ncbi:MAG: hypothetical protein KJ964_07985 [Verrucomicrobia bacterium]|nr:hypothetical protein [Verrucomicrobiota bacterium]MBU1734997.1 hypothetical protein [Verrucomicrobiota bacterium]MBU1856270.1 hypothetical protein [Verrucomicrobiota bacterium]